MAYNENSTSDTFDINCIQGECNVTLTATSNPSGGTITIGGNPLPLTDTITQGGSSTINFTAMAPASSNPSVESTYTYTITASIEGGNSQTYTYTQTRAAVFCPDGWITNYDNSTCNKVESMVIATYGYSSSNTNDTYTFTFPSAVYGDTIVELVGGGGTGATWPYGTEGGGGAEYAKMTIPSTVAPVGQTFSLTVGRQGIGGYKTPEAGYPSSFGSGNYYIYARGGVAARLGQVGSINHAARSTEVVNGITKFYGLGGGTSGCYSGGKSATYGAGGGACETCGSTGGVSYQGTAGIGGSGRAIGGFPGGGGGGCNCYPSETAKPGGHGIIRIKYTPITVKGFNEM
jgi:hypothetical protein